MQSHHIQPHCMQSHRIQPLRMDGHWAVFTHQFESITFPTILCMKYLMAPGVTGGATLFLRWLSVAIAMSPVVLSSAEISSLVVCRLAALDCEFGCRSRTRSALSPFCLLVGASNFNSVFSSWVPPSSGRFLLGDKTELNSDSTRRPLT